MHAALLIAALLLAGCAITPRRVELGASTAGRDCTKGCALVTPRRIQFRFSF